jgi:Tfp pilus assembly protein PilV
MEYYCQLKFIIRDCAMSKPAVLQHHRRTNVQQRGTTMIEIMVAGLVLSAGLLGLAAMQTKALKTASGLATQQTMVQALGAFGEARLANPNHNMVGVTGPDSDSESRLPTYCNSFWAAMPVNEEGTAEIDTPTTLDLSEIRTHLGRYTSCSSAAITEYADYWNQFGTYGMNSTTNGTGCDYIVPRTRTVRCTLPTGDEISLQNRVWVR